MENIKLSNFRKIKDTWDLDLAPITFFTGTNNSGKSTIFKALLLLEDFVKSTNHFQLDFKGPNSEKHKINSYKDAINGFMLNDSNWDLNFTYHNLEHIISLRFQPQSFDDGIANKGKLIHLEIIRDYDKSKLSIENTGGDNYLLKLENSFLEDGSNLKFEDDLKNIKNLISVTQYEIASNEEKLAKLTSIENSIKNNSHDDSYEELLRDFFKSWLIKTKDVEDSDTLILSLERLSEKMERDIFAIHVIDEAEELFKEVLKLEKQIPLLLFYDNSSPRFIPADTYHHAMEYYIEFLEESRAVNLDLAQTGDLKNIQIVRQEDFSKISRNIIGITQKTDSLKKNLAVLKKQEKLMSSNSIEKTVLSPEFSLSEFDSRFLSIDEIIKDLLPKYFLEGQKQLGKTDESIELKKAYEFADNIRDVLSFSVDHLSPHRNTQISLYVNNSISSDINEVIKEHSVNPISKTSVAGKFLQEWMKKFDIGKDYNINQIEGVASQIKIIDNDVEINLADKGFGAGQVFTILLKIALVVDIKEDTNRTIQKKYRRKGFEEFLNKILIEEPEANLHPALQSKLADLFYDVYNDYGIQFIIETHSEYILRQSQVHIKNLYKNLNIPNELPFGVYYFDEDKGPYKMRYDEEGKFIEDFGSGFFDVSRKLTRKLL